MNREQFRRDVVSVLREHDLFVHKVTWTEDPVKGGLQVGIVAGGALPEDVQMSLVSEDAINEAIANLPASWSAAS